MKLSRAGHRAWIVLVAFLASAVSAGAGVLVVSSTAGPGVDATTIQAAVNAALEGDTILVRNGVYGAFTINGKSLSVVADGSSVKVQVTTGGTSVPTVTVTNLMDGQEVVVRGLQTNFGVSVSNCSGAVWFDELDVAGASSSAQCQFSAIAGAGVSSSNKVTFTRSTLRGEVGNTNAFLSVGSSAGLSTGSSTLQLYDCVIEGGAGGSAAWTAEQPGAPGMRVDGSMVTIIGCTIRGGDGGLAYGPVCTTPHAVGGAGLEFAAMGGTVQSAESTAVGGAADLGPLCPGLTGPAGPAITGSGTIVPLVGYARHLQAGSPVRGGETLTFAVAGQPGEVPLLFVSLGHEPVPLPSFSGVLLVGLPWTDMFQLSPLPASGQTSFSFPVPNVGVLVGSLTYYAQAAFLDPTPRIWLGAGTTVTLLDAGY